MQLREDVWRLPLTVAWFWPPSDGTFWGGLWGFTFGTAILTYNPGPSAELRKVLVEGWVNQFGDDSFGTSLREGDDQHMYARAIAHDDVAKHIDLLANRLDKVLADLRAL